MSSQAASGAGGACDRTHVPLAVHCWVLRRIPCPSSGVPPSPSSFRSSERLGFPGVCHGYEGLAYSTLDETAWQGTSRRIKALVEQEYRDKFGGNSVMADRDNSIALKSGRDVNVLRWANSFAAQIRKSDGIE